MQLDTEAAEIKLNREKMLLYDSIRTDTLSVIKYAGARLREQVDFLTDEQRRKFNAAITATVNDAVKRFTEYRQERAKKATPSETELENGYWQYDQKKTQEERAAAQAAEQERAQRSRASEAKTLEEIEHNTLDVLRQYAYGLLTARPRGHEEAQAFQTARAELETHCFFAMKDAKTREAIEAIAQEFTRRLDEKAKSILN